MMDRIPGFAYSGNTMPAPPPLSTGRRRRRILIHVLIIHILVIFTPLALIFYNRWRHPQESMFKVRLRGELSTGEVVGEPMRRPPSENPGRRPEPPVEPKVPAPRVQEPAVTPKKTVSTPKKSVATKPAVPKKKVATPKKTSTPKKSAQTTKRTSSTEKARPKRPTTVEEAQAGVYRPPRDEHKTIGDGGGSNRNAMVPVGRRDQAQTFGRQNNATPGGGGDAESSRYGKLVGEYLKTRWAEPPRTLLEGREPRVLIELAIAADGRVTGARILRASGVPAMDESVRRLFQVLDRVPRPGSGSLSLQVELVCSDQ